VTDGVGVLLGGFAKGDVEKGISVSVEVAVDVLPGRVELEPGRTVGNVGCCDIGSLWDLEPESQMAQA
jgi:hypothetical protein